MKILVAEDEPIMLKMICMRLSKDGHTLIATDNGRDALELITKEQPDLIITDIMMPYSSGLEIVGKVKQTGTTPVIVLSSMGQETTVLEAFSLGADDYITKPFSPNELSMRVRRFSVEKKAGFNFLVFGNLPLLKQFVPYQYLLNASLMLSCFVACMLGFILMYLIWNLNRKSKEKHLVRLYSTLISEVILCDNIEDCQAVMQQPYVQKIRSKWFGKTFGRMILIGQLVKMHKSIAGQGATNLCWLYNHLELQDDSLKAFNSSRWHVKARAIQELSEMQQVRFLTRIYKAADNSNKYVRNEAQVALLKLAGFDGLRFLNVVSRPISAWQQLCLLRELSLETAFDLQRIRHWMRSPNDSVVIFSLRLVKSQMLYKLEDEVKDCLLHTNGMVREHARKTLMELSGNPFSSTEEIFTQEFHQAPLTA